MQPIKIQKTIYKSLKNEMKIRERRDKKGDREGEKGKTEKERGQGEERLKERGREEIR